MSELAKIRAAVTQAENAGERPCSWRIGVDRMALIESEFLVVQIVKHECTEGEKVNFIEPIKLAGLPVRIVPEPPDACYLMGEKTLRSL